MKCMIIVGTRAELIKVFPVIKEIKKRDHDLVFVHTGQHDLKDLCATFNIPEPDTILSETPDDSSKFKGSALKAIKWNIGLLYDIQSIIRHESPDYVLYHGDTMSTGLAALGSSRLFFPLRRFKTAHIEAGLRSGSIREPFPEELSRIFADSVSNILFAVSEQAGEHLTWHQRIGKDIETVGNTIVDSATAAEKIGDPYEKEGYGIVTVHRHENIKSRKRMEKIVKIIEKSPRELIFPLHDNTRDALEKYGLLHRIQESDTVTIHELIDYPDFINMLKNADILYTDGGSMQEESLMYHVPCVILRNRTERKEGLATGINYLSKFEVEETRKKAEELVKKEKKDYKNPYGEPGVSKRIVDRLEEKLP